MANKFRAVFVLMVCLIQIKYGEFMIKHGGKFMNYVAFNWCHFIYHLSCILRRNPNGFLLIKDCTVSPSFQYNSLTFESLNHLFSILTDSKRFSLSRSRRSKPCYKDFENAKILENRIPDVLQSSKIILRSLMILEQD